MRDQYFNAETGLHQNWNRDYAPGIGRYIQADPIGLAEIECLPVCLWESNGLHGYRGEIWHPWFSWGSWSESFVSSYWRYDTRS
ncbi:RHS repeat-associated core domain-containing protein [Ottowia sp. 10c7w1]|uniref:RHS repeat-associated core domain-containing protein n=1 Tax=Ottowia cancrivicina TaxID=3040346 RepID=UPI0024423E8F|nr:RHS repeat-associated core domain-containing protein [Ottowia sp. 10c7w1]